MEIDPLLINIKTPDELPVAIPTSAGYFFYWEGSTLKKALMTDIYNKVNGAFGGKLMIADDPDPTVPTWYFAGESGAFPNAGALVADTDGQLVIFNFDGTTWSMIETVAQNITIIDLNYDDLTPEQKEEVSFQLSALNKTIPEINERLDGQYPSPFSIGTIEIKSDYETNTFVGNLAGEDNTPISPTEGRQNTFIGMAAGRFNTTGYASLSVGYSAGYSNTTGTTNTNIGYQSGYNNETGMGNVNVGTDAGGGNLASQNIFIGFHTGGSVSTPLITGEHNVFLGVEAATTGGSMHDNVGVGYRVGFNMTSGYQNAMFGSIAGFNITTGYNNILFGNEAGFSLVTGNNNFYMGYRSGFYSTAYANVGIGSYSLFNATTGALNTSIGNQSGMAVTTGLWNVFIGADAGVDPLQKVDALNSIAIGYLTYTTENNQTVIGNDTMQNVYFGSVAGNARVIAKTARFTNIPTSATGLATGDIWSNAGVLTIV